jgi:hypothetical protein
MDDKGNVHGMITEDEPQPTMLARIEDLENQAMQAFRRGYEDLVKETGCGVQPSVSIKVLSDGTLKVQAELVVVRLPREA